MVEADDAEGDQLISDHCPSTPARQITGKGRTHYLFRRPREDAFPYIPNRQKTSFKGKLFNVDIRGDGGYILAPGSIHPETLRAGARSRQAA